jgi:hypothetical protein
VTAANTAIVFGRGLGVPVVTVQATPGVVTASGGGGPPEPPSGVTAVVVAGPQVNLAWSMAGITDATDVSIERRDVTAHGAFAEIDTTGDGGAETYEGDLGPFTAKHRYQYRVVVVGGASDGLTSNVVTVFGGAVGYLRRRRRAL